MFDWKEKVQFLRENPRYNNAGVFGIQIEAKENTSWMASVYRLGVGDDWPDYLICIEVLCKQNARDSIHGVLWGARGMTNEEQNLVGAIFADKPETEIKTHPLPAGQHIWLEIAGGDRVVNLNTVDNPNSYLVLFQEVDKSPLPPDPPPEPDPDPPPAPDPDPPISTAGYVVVNQAQVALLEPDAEGNVTIPLARID
jgi:hypothetical protein